MSNVEKPSEQVTVQQKVRDAIHGVVNPDTKTAMSTSNRFKEDPVLRMRAAEWHGTQDIRVVSRPAPAITESTDAIVRITVSTVCGSDLHMYYNKVPGVQVMQKGDIPGHEAVGVVESVGSGVSKFKVGDRVVVSPVIACGSCGPCKRQCPSACDTTNPSGQMEMLYGHRTAALFGYSHLTGGFAGLQAERARIPLADNNLYPIPSNVTDEQAISVSDVLNTGWHGNELAKVRKGSTVCVWGCGPVGLCAQMLALVRGAKVVYAVDNDLTRLALAASLGAHPINFDVDKSIPKALSKVLPGGPECSIDCVGFRFPKGWNHYLQQKVGLETDSPEVINECIWATAKNGHIALIGDYFNTCNNFAVGSAMEKGLTIAGGQLWPQKYWPTLMPLLAEGKVKPLALYSHRLHFNDISKAYAMFGAKEDDCTKVLLKTDYGLEQEKVLGHAQHPFGKCIDVEHLLAKLPDNATKTPLAA